MAKAYHKQLRFPILGLNKSTSYSQGPEFHSAYVNNFWPIQWSTGRTRGGTRLGTDAFVTSISGQPCNWCPTTWDSSSGSQTTYRGVAVSNTNGVWISTGSSFDEAITNSAASDFNSCAVYNNDLYFARFGEAALVRTLTTPGSAGGTTVDATWSEGFAETPGSGTNGGTPPDDCGLVSVHMNRLVLAGSKASPQVLSMSRAGYPKDWDYAQTDTGAAWQTAGGQSAQIGEPITALIPHTDNCLIVGCTDSMYVVSGNPTSTGAIYKISDTIGPLSQASWCKTSNGWTFIMTRDGLYRMAPGCPSTAPEPVSRKVLPEDLVAIDPGTSGTYVSLGYDSRWRGIHIYVNKSGDSNTYYFYDLENGGFWPMTFSTTMRLAVNHKVAAESTESAILAMTSTGASYQFTTDSTESIASYLTYGPILLAPEGSEGMLNEVIASLAENSGTVSWKVYFGNTAAEAYRNLTNDWAGFTGVDWTVGTTDRPGSSTGGARMLQYTQNPLIAGQCCYLKIYSSGAETTRISVEEIELVSTEAGPRRVL